MILVVDPARPEDLSRYHSLLDSDDPLPAGKLSPNDPCPCGSGKKFKHGWVRQIEEVEKIGRHAGPSLVPGHGLRRC